MATRGGRETFKVLRVMVPEVFWVERREADDGDVRTLLLSPASPEPPDWTMQAWPAHFLVSTNDESYAMIWGVTLCYHFYDTNGGQMKKYFHTDNKHLGESYRVPINIKRNTMQQLLVGCSILACCVTDEGIDCWLTFIMRAWCLWENMMWFQTVKYLLIPQKA